MKKRNPFAFAVILLVGGLLMTACNTPAAAPTQDNASIIATSIQQTMEKMQETQASVPTSTMPIAANTPTSPVLANAPTVAAVSAPTSVPTAMSTNCLVAGLVSETIPDNSLMARGAKFTKTWRVINAGTCAWTTAYKLIYKDGYDLGAIKEVALKENVPPGGITNISVDMTAPNVDGTYIGNWMLTTNTGVNIAPLYVKIYVGTPTLAPYWVTGVTVTPVDIDTNCANPYKLDVKITTNGPGIVTYWITDTFGGPYSKQELKFDTAGTVTTAHTMTFPADADNYFVEVYIDTPNHAPYTTRIDVNCS